MSYVFSLIECVKTLGTNDIFCLGRILHIARAKLGKHIGVFPKRKINHIVYLYQATLCLCRQNCMWTMILCISLHPVLSASCVVIENAVLT